MEKVRESYRKFKFQVTLVQNLEHFLIRPQEFAELMRKKAQASTSITALAGSKPTQPLQQVLKLKFSYLI